MGIPGIYKELGPGTRISLAKLAVEHLENTGQRFRLAIDISIWQFQIQSGQGGQNPALRTLYYRLLKLLGLGIQPLFVFDGPNKPKLKRNVTTVPFAACLDNFLTKHLLKRFGFPYHDAPGEAEAECALLQKEGIVDAVLSEDVDTIMFGCTRSLRHWTAEGARSSKTPTHVSMYTAEVTEKSTGLDSFGMILVALMSGGDYDTDGLAKCGPKIACEAARAGFGKQLCLLAEDDGQGWQDWRQRLQHELHTNKSKFFKQKHKTVNIPDTFPDRNILSYYKCPTVSSSEKVASLRPSIKWNLEIDVPELRNFVAEAFSWTYLIGAKHFIRTFAPALLAHKLLGRNTKADCLGDDLDAKAAADARYITSIHGHRSHWNTDGCPELRVSYVPIDIVGLDLTIEEDIDQGDTGIGAEADAGESECEERGRSVSPTKQRGPPAYDPTQPEKIWMLETFVKLGVPLLVETWEEDMRDPKRFATRKARAKAAASKKITQQGAIHQFVKITKTSRKTEKNTEIAIDEGASAKLPPVFLTPTLAPADSSVASKALEENRRSVGKRQAKKSVPPVKTKKKSGKDVIDEEVAVPASPSKNQSNPWTLAKRPSDTYGFTSPTRYSALGIYAPNDSEQQEPRSRRLDSPRQRETASPRALDTTAPCKKHACGSSSSEGGEEERGASSPLTNITLRTPIRRDAAKPSPKKKRNPIKISNELFSTGQLKMPKSMPNKKIAAVMSNIPTSTLQDRNIINLDDNDDTPEAPPTPLTAKRANRKLNFTNPNTPPRTTSPASDQSSLPSPSALLSPETKTGMAISLQSAERASEAPTATKKKKCKDAEVGRKLIALRESLEGAWKHLEPWEASAAKDVFASVEVLDMTRSQ